MIDDKNVKFILKNGYGVNIIRRQNIFIAEVRQAKEKEPEFRAEKGYEFTDNTIDVYRTVLEDILQGTDYITEGAADVCVKSIG